jgi:hypothetical protein
MDRNLQGRVGPFSTPTGGECREVVGQAQGYIYFAPGATAIERATGTMDNVFHFVSNGHEYTTVVAVRGMAFTIRTVARRGRSAREVEWDNDDSPSCDRAAYVRYGAEAI